MLTHAGVTAGICRGGPGPRVGGKHDCGRGPRSRRGPSAGKHAFARREFCRDGRRAVVVGKLQVGSGAKPGSHRSIVGLSCFYDPTTAQFLSRDPINPLTRSPYGYVGNNPLDGTDPSGLMCWNPTDRDCLGEIADNLYPDDAPRVVQDVGCSVSTWGNRVSLAATGVLMGCATR